MNYRIDGQEYPVVVIRKNNKNTYIRIKNGMIEVSTHYLATKNQIYSILEKNQLSISKMMAQYQSKVKPSNEFQYLGKNYDIIKMPINEVTIIGTNLYTTSDDQLKKWYQNQLNKVFISRYDICYHQFEEHIPYYRLRIRKMKTRWGVCNRSSQTITLNSELLHYSVEAIDYVIIHELAHLVHFNHSQLFWELVSKYCPNYKQMKKELKE